VLLSKHSGLCSAQSKHFLNKQIKEQYCTHLQMAGARHALAITMTKPKTASAAVLASMSNDTTLSNAQKTTLM
jgi:hypothetical protein